MVMTRATQVEKIKSALMDLHFRSPSNLVDDTVASFVDWSGDMAKAFYNDTGVYISVDHCRRLSGILDTIMNEVAGAGKYKPWSAGYFGEVANLLINQVTFVKIA